MENNILVHTSIVRQNHRQLWCIILSIKSKTYSVKYRKENEMRKTYKVNCQYGYSITGEINSFVENLNKDFLDSNKEFFTKEQIQNLSPPGS